MIIHGLLFLLMFQAVGELISKFVLPLMPGPVIGLVLLLLFLKLRGRIPPSMDTVGSTILQHLGLLFIPASVGVLMYWPLIASHALAISLALLLSVALTIASTALSLKWLSKNLQTPTHENDAS